VRLKRFAARQARRARDDFAGARAESPEIDGRDLTALREERGDHVLAVRVGPPFIPPLLFFRPACHGNTKMFPRAYLIQLREAAGVPKMARRLPVLVTRIDTGVEPGS
jgi:hypothetical protein